MTTTHLTDLSAETAVIPVDGGVRCEAVCTDPGCTAAALMLLLCTPHADDAEQTHTITRRPL